MGSWVKVFVLSASGALGVNARYWLGVWMNRRAPATFPWATFTINVSGSFAIGFLSTALMRWLPHHPVRLFFLVGFLGGYTTFSTFAFESLVLWERGEKVLALANVAGSVIAGLAAAALGVALARALVAPNERLAQATADAAHAVSMVETSVPGSTLGPEVPGE